MADEANGASPAPQAGSVSDGNGTPATPPRSDEPLRNLGEVVDLKKQVRGLDKRFDDFEAKMLAAVASLRTQATAPAGEKPAEKPSEVKNGPAPEPARSEVAELRREIELKDLYADFGIRDAKKRELLTAAVKASNPQNLREFVESYAPILASPNETETKPTAPPAPPGKSDTGAPGAAPAHALPSDPHLIPASQWRGMGREERMKRHQSRLNERGLDVNPFARK